MITKTALDSAIISNPSHTASVKVLIADANGDLQELNAAIAYSTDQTDFTQQVDISEDVDTHPTAKITVLRQSGAWSLAPEAITGNPLASAGSPIDIGRAVQVDAFVEGPDGGPTGNSVTIFDGVIDDVAWPDEQIEISCSDRIIAACRDTFIEWERVYGLCTGAYATKGALIWRDQSDAKVLEVGDLVLPSKLNANGHFYRVTAKTSAQAVAEPTWPTGSGATVVSGGVTLTESGATSTTGTAVQTIMQQILNDNGLSWVSLYTPVSPGWNVRPYKQQRESVLAALETLAEQLGWSLRRVYDNGTSSLRLTLFQPPRTASVAVKTIGVEEERGVDETSRSLGEIRNVVRIIYGDSTTRDADGAPIRKLLEFSDATSITKYGRRFMEIAEADVSNIDTAAEATTLGQAVLADLKDPATIVGETIACDPFLQLDDMVTVPADGLRFTSDQTLAIFGIAHSFRAEGATTKMRLRAKPSAGVLTWLGKDVKSFEDQMHGLYEHGLPAGTKTIIPVIGGARTVIGGDQVDARRFGEHFEIHVGTAPGFTPSALTLKGSGQMRQFEVVDLVPGKTYYQRQIPFTFNASQKILGSPSAEQSFVAGRGKIGHCDSASTQSHLPLNGNFEHWSGDDSIDMPDHWFLGDGSETYGFGESVSMDVDATKGKYIALGPHATKRGWIRSSRFEVRRGLRQLNMYISFLRTGASAVSGKDLIVDVKGYTFSDDVTPVVNSSIFFSGSASGPYPTEDLWYDVAYDITGTIGTLASNVNFLEIEIRRGTSGDSSFAWWIGDVFLQEADFMLARLTQPAWTAPSYATNWGAVGGGWSTPGYLLDSMGFVRLRGGVKVTTGTLTSTIFTLPAGYRPASQLQFPLRMGTNVLSYLTINTSGVVAYGGGVLADAQAGLFLDGINFDTR